MLEFSLIKTDENSSARAGIIKTIKGDIFTPIFMPVGTAASVKALSQTQLIDDLNAEIILSNTYHLYLRPGLEILKNAGGLHKFMNWDKPILTDSGGYQVYSLSESRRIYEGGVEFKSHVDGSRHFFSPESVIDAQRIIGSDILMPLDECTPFSCSYDYTKESINRTHKWLDSAIKHFKNSMDDLNRYQSLFPIVQGSTYKDLRLESAKIASDNDMNGYAIGGVCHQNGMLAEVASWVCNILPHTKPRYLMGVGMPSDILNCISVGIDMFDCVLPSRNARNGSIFTTSGILNIRNAKFKNDFSPIDIGLCGSSINMYTMAYLHHLFMSREMLGATLATIQNLSFYLWLVRTARSKILDGNFTQWKNSILPIISKKV